MYCFFSADLSLWRAGGGEPDHGEGRPHSLQSGEICQAQAGVQIQDNNNNAVSGSQHGPGHGLRAVRLPLQCRQRGQRQRARHQE